MEFIANYFLQIYYTLDDILFQTPIHFQSWMYLYTWSAVALLGLWGGINGALWLWRKRRFFKDRVTFQITRQFYREAVRLSLRREFHPERFNPALKIDVLLLATMLFVISLALGVEVICWTELGDDRLAITIMTEVCTTIVLLWFLIKAIRLIWIWRKLSREIFFAWSARLATLVFDNLERCILFFVRLRPVITLSRFARWLALSGLLIFWMLTLTAANAYLHAKDVCRHEFAGYGFTQDPDWKVNLWIHDSSRVTYRYLGYLNSNLAANYSLHESSRYMPMSCAWFRKYFTEFCEAQTAKLNQLGWNRARFDSELQAVNEMQNELLNSKPIPTAEFVAALNRMDHLIHVNYDSDRKLLAVNHLSLSWTNRKSYMPNTVKAVFKGNRIWWGKVNQYGTQGELDSIQLWDLDRGMTIANNDNYCSTRKYHESDLETYFWIIVASILALCAPFFLLRSKAPPFVASTSYELSLP